MGVDANGVGIFTVDIEQVPDKGEDASPLVVRDPHGPAGFLGAFDGVGGAGAALVETENGPQTAARVASRTVRATVASLAHWLCDGRGRFTPDEADRLHAELAKALAGRERAVGPSVTSKLRGGLVRSLPSTMAVVQYIRHTDGIELRYVWAGDSRVYVLTPEHGLQQLTRDEIKSGGDAMHNLGDDSPMSNMLSADGKFSLAYGSTTLDTTRAIVLAATDGCFGYVPTPMHFESQLLHALTSVPGPQETNTISRVLEGDIRGVAGDDATLAGAVIGWSSSAEMRDDFAARRDEIARRLTPFEEAAESEQALRRALELMRHVKERSRQELWAGYKPLYEAHLGTGRPDPELAAVVAAEELAR